MYWQNWQSIFPNAEDTEQVEHLIGLIMDESSAFTLRLCLFQFPVNFSVMYLNICVFSCSIHCVRELVDNFVNCLVQSSKHCCSLSLSTHLRLNPTPIKSQMIESGARQRAILPSFGHIHLFAFEFFTYNMAETQLHMQTFFFRCSAKKLTRFGHMMTTSIDLEILEIEPHQVVKYRGFYILLFWFNQFCHFLLFISILHVP